MLHGEIGGVVVTGIDSPVDEVGDRLERVRGHGGVGGGLMLLKMERRSAGSASRVELNGLV